MLSKTLQKFLDTNKIKHEVIKHKTVYTAFDKAATLRAKPQEVGKTVVVCFDKKHYMLGLIPSNKNLDKKKLLKAINNSPNSPSYFKRGVGGVKNNRVHFSRLDFTTEKWLKANIKGASLGATPPFATLYKLPFFIDNSLLKLEKIVVNGGAYELSIKLAPVSLIKLDPSTLKGSFSMAKK